MLFAKTVARLLNYSNLPTFKDLVRKTNKQIRVAYQAEVDQLSYQSGKNTLRTLDICFLESEVHRLYNKATTHSIVSSESSMTITGAYQCNFQFISWWPLLEFSNAYVSLCMAYEETF